MNVIPSSYVNAWSLAYGLTILGQPWRCAADNTKFLTPSGGPPKPGERLFATSEDTIIKYRGDHRFTGLPVLGTLPLDDKLATARYVENISIRSVPTISLEEALLNTTIEWPVCVKPTSSWHHGKKNPRGWKCHDSHSWTEALKALTMAGLPYKNVVVQPWLTSKAEHNVSVCGFFDANDPRRRLTIVCRRLLSDTSGLACSSIVETIPDPSNLIERTHLLLEHAGFQGPFEVEFLYQPDIGDFLLLEINPRFWMQHGIFIKCADNMLIKMALGERDFNGQAQRQAAKAKLVWYNPLYVIRQRTLTHQKKIWSIFIRSSKQQRKITSMPKWTNALAYITRAKVQKAKQLFTEHT